MADAVAEWLAEKGITHAMGVIGGGNLPLWDAISRLQKTALISVHHEQAAAMASAYFNRIRHGVGSIALVTTGGGSSNAITGVLAAYMDRVPLLVISGNEASKYFSPPHDRLRVQGVQGFQSAELVMPCVKECGQHVGDQNVELYLEEMCAIAMTPPQGPVWIDLPKDVQSAAI